MVLSDSQMKALHDDGYVVVPGVVPRTHINAALKAINRSIGAGMEPSKIDSFYKVSFCPELCTAPVITDLINDTPARDVIESAIGPGRVLWPKTGQLALRFPTFRDPVAPRPHLDGMSGPRDGKPGSLTSFTAVVGVQLSDLPATGMGNIAVWPGSHLRCARYFEERGPASLLEGMPPIDLGQPIQLTAAAGDLFLMHYLLVHAITTNHSPHIRYTTYYRLKHVDHDAQQVDAILQPWLHWEPIRAAFAIEQEPIQPATAIAKPSGFRWFKRKRA